MDFDKEIDKFAKQVDFISGILDTDQEDEAKKLTDQLEMLQSKFGDMTIKQRDRYIRERERLEQIMKLVANQKEITKKLEYFVERRNIVRKDNFFIGITDEGEKIRIEEGILIRYLEEILNKALENPGRKFDMVNLLYFLDQEPFYDGVLEDDDGNILDYADSIMKLKDVLKKQSEEIPEVVATLMKKTKVSTKQHEEVNKKYNEYVIKLLEEGIITEEVLIEAEFLKEVDAEDLMELYQSGKITKTLLINSKSLRNIGKNKLQELIDSEFFEGVSTEEIAKLQKNKFLNLENIIELHSKNIIDDESMIEAAGGIEEIVKNLRRAERNKKARDIKKFRSLLALDPVGAWDAYINGKLSPESIKGIDIDKEFIMKLPEDEFLKFAQKGFPQEIAIKSNELIDEYISKYSGTTLIALSKIGYIEPEELLQLMDKEISPKDKERAITAQEIMEFYTPSMILGMLTENKINTEFIKDLDGKVLSTFDEEERSEYMKKIIEGSLYKMEESRYAETMISLLESDNFPHEYFEDLRISENVLMDMYLEEALSEEQIIEYFNQGILNEKAIKIIYGEDYNTLIKLVKGGQLIEKALAILPVDVLREKLMPKVDLAQGDLTPEEIFRLYAKYDSLNISELSSMFEEYGNKLNGRVHLVSMIEKGFDINKIRELYLYDVLTHSDLLELQETGIITEEECEEIAKMDLAKFYKEIFDQNKKVENIYDGLQIEEGERRSRDGKNYGLPDVPKFPEVSAQAKKEFFKALGAYDYQDIESFDSEGEEAPFGNYKMLGFLDYGLAVFENFEEGGNATYIMTFQELKSYIIKEAEKSIVFRKSKQALRDEITKGRAVKVCNHTVNWGNNVIEAMKSLSKDTRKNIGEEEQSRLATEMQEEYRNAKEAQLEAEKEALEAARAKQNEVMELERRTKEEFEKKRGKTYGE